MGIYLDEDEVGGALGPVVWPETTTVAKITPATTARRKGRPGTEAPFDEE